MPNRMRAGKRRAVRRSWPGGSSRQLQEPEAPAPCIVGDGTGRRIGRRPAPLRAGRKGQRRREGLNVVDHSESEGRRREQNAALAVQRCDRRFVHVAPARHGPDKVPADCAAYWIGSQATRFVATPSGEVGSIGVFLLHVDACVPTRRSVEQSGRCADSGSPNHLSLRVEKTARVAGSTDPRPVSRRQVAAHASHSA